MGRELDFEDLRCQALRRRIGAKPPHGFEKWVVTGLRPYHTVRQVPNRLPPPRIAQRLCGLLRHLDLDRDNLVDRCRDIAEGTTESACAVVRHSASTLALRSLCGARRPQTLRAGA